MMKKAKLKEKKTMKNTQAQKITMMTSMVMRTRSSKKMRILQRQRSKIMMKRMPRR